MSGGFQLRRDAFGQLVFTGADGVEVAGVEPARAFPITAAREGIGLLSREGHEVAWIGKLDELPAAVRELVEEELESRDFIPEIQRVKHVSGYAVPSTWRVETDRGEADLVLKAEEDIRRLSGTALLISDSRGIQFLIRNPQELDAPSRRMLAHFL